MLREPLHGGVDPTPDLDRPFGVIRERTGGALEIGRGKASLLQCCVPGSRPRRAVECRVLLDGLQLRHRLHEGRVVHAGDVAGVPAPIHGSPERDMQYHEQSRTHRRARVGRHERRVKRT